MTIETEPIGSIPRPLRLIEVIASKDGTDTIGRFEATGSPVITDGEQRKHHNFWTYCVHGLPNTDPNGFKIPFAAGHTRRMLRLTGGPFRYRRQADSYLDAALLHEHENEVRNCLRKGAHKVQIDFTEGRLAVKIDTSGELLHSFIDLNNLALSRFTVEDRQRIGVHTCPGGDLDSTHSADVDAFLRRHVHHPRHGFREDPRAGARHGHGG